MVEGRKGAGRKGGEETKMCSSTKMIKKKLKKKRIKCRINAILKNVYKKDVLLLFLCPCSANFEKRYVEILVSYLDQVSTVMHELHIIGTSSSHNTQMKKIF